jgi:hypothetical protein
VLKKSNYSVVVFKKDEHNQWWLEGTQPHLPGNTTPRLIKPLFQADDGKTVVLKRIALLVDAEEKFAYYKVYFHERGTDLVETIGVSDSVDCKLNASC